MLPPPSVERISLPAPPAPPPRAGFPWAATLAPVVVSLALWALTRSLFSLMFALLGPLVAVGGVVDGRFSRRRSARRDAAAHADAVGRVIERVQAIQRREHDRLTGLVARPENPSWDQPASSPVAVRLGTGTVVSVVRLDVGDTQLPDGDAAATAQAATAQAAADDPRGAPLVADARDGIGVVGPPVLAAAVARALAVQVAARLSPATAALRAPGDETWAPRLPHRAEEGDAGVFEWSAEPAPPLVIAWAADPHELPLGCAVRFVLIPAEVAGPGVIAQVETPAPIALTLAAATAAAEVLASRAAELGLRPAGADVPDLVELSRLLATGPVADGLSAPIGCDASGPVIIDLVSDGPHALIAGTTGSGKSELLVSWVLAMAHGRSPDQVSFLLIDFKGGAAFAPLARLPHVVATLSDLDPRLTRRAIESLQAELLRRERVLADAGVRAIDDLPAGLLARLVIVVDEFAAVVAASPQLHEVFADLAARGRSLGLHLVLCTQRPAGVVRDAVLANVGVRVSLRVTDRSDSTAMVGDDAAARLPAAIRGRAILSGAGSRRTVQVALASAGDADEIASASPAARAMRPWCDPLPAELELGALPPSPDGLVFGMADLPAEQRQPPAAHDLERHGHLLVIGAAGAGSTTALTTLALSATRRSMPVHVLSGDPAEAWAQLTALGDSGDAASERPLVVIDDLDALLARFGPDHAHEALQLLTLLLRGGSARHPVLAVSCRRLSGALAGVAGLFGSRLLLRQSTRDDHVLAGGDAATFDPDLPPGCGSWRGAMVQVARAAGAALPAPPVPVPPRVSPARHPVIALVAARPRAYLVALRASGVRVVQLGRDAVPEPHELQIATGATPTVVLGDPDAWQADWTLLTTARREWPIVMIGCTIADHRALLRDREPPPPLGSRAGECWLSVEGRTVRAVLELGDSGPDAPESEEKDLSNR